MNLARGRAFQQRGVCSITVLTELIYIMHTLHNHAQHVNYIIASLYRTLLFIHMIGLIIKLSPVTTAICNIQHLHDVVTSYHTV